MIKGFSQKLNPFFYEVLIYFFFSGDRDDAVSGSGDVAGFEVGRRRGQQPWLQF
jgi:hypothetical protein